MAESSPEQRLSLDEALAYARHSGKAAFAAAPVFGDDPGAAEGARVFIVHGDGQGGCRVRFIAGPFFSAAFAANELLAENEIPERVRAMRFLRTSFSEDWFTDQVQVLIGKLTQAAQVAVPQMPDYLGAPLPKAAPEVVFPLARIGRAGSAGRSDGSR